ncbi:HNH endonuclease signature motif containing protein [Methylobacterium sp. Leaf118]|uniref:HNH endonuclease signature motif containing protein n=1 Tax=Methylobacterium sp. Leaf118 TaxID=2876562 RepID=UPI001E2A6B07|nr:HNH endonuclease signature motif containing protein [Methylobacterium sp. Leaf118]
MTDALHVEHEEWRPLSVIAGHSVSSFGRVRRDLPRFGGGGSIRPPLECLSLRKLPTGYIQVDASINGRRTTHYVHRLVAEAFLGPPKAGQDRVLHKDDDPSNNRPDNLCWGTAADNSADMVRKGRQAKGVRAGASKLSPDMVLSVRRDSASGISQRKIASKYGICQANVSLIVSCATWRDI